MVSGDMSVRLPSDISRWRTKHAQAWLTHTMELPQYVDAFQKASIDGILLVDYMTETHLEDIIGERERERAGKRVRAGKRERDSV